jgi:signal peptidase I
VDFSLVLFIALVVTGGIILIHKIFAGNRVEAPVLDSQGAATASVSQPVIVEYARALFPVILIVFVLRSFIVEPFRIPSGSMLPSLHIGDFILVNKFKYGIRLPVINRKILPMGSPDRGDVMVFKYPVNPELNFIKRVVGLPGDTLSYVDKQLSINGVPVQVEEDGEFEFKQAKLRGSSALQFTETIDESTHKILKDGSRKSRNLEQVIVPPGHYFVMGDNRDHSNDSRYWRFVPEANVVGKAFFIWFSWKSTSGGGVEWSRIGNIIQ